MRLEEISDELNQRGYRTTGNRGNNPFLPDNVADMLQSRFYLGSTTQKTKACEPVGVTSRFQLRRCCVRVAQDDCERMMRTPVLE